MRLLTSIALFCLASACASDSRTADRPPESVASAVSTDLRQPSDAGTTALQPPTRPEDPGSTPVLINGPEIDFCGTLFEFFDVRSSFRAAIGDGTPIGFFPEEHRDTWDALRRLAVELDDQLYNYGPLVGEESAPAPGSVEIRNLVGIENELRLAVFADPSIGLHLAEDWEDSSDRVHRWAQTSCGFDRIEVAPASSYNLGQLESYGFDVGDENYCARLEDALELRAVIGAQMRAGQFDDRDRRTDLELTIKQFELILFGIEDDYRLATGENMPFRWSFEAAPSSALFYAVNDYPVEDVVRVDLAEDEQFLDGVAASCPGIEASIVERARGLESMMDMARQS